MIPAAFRPAGRGAPGLCPLSAVTSRKSRSGPRTRRRLTPNGGTRSGSASSTHGVGAVDPPPTRQRLGAAMAAAFTRRWAGSPARPDAALPVRLAQVRSRIAGLLGRRASFCLRSQAASAARRIGAESSPAVRQLVEPFPWRRRLGRSPAGCRPAEGVQRHQPPNPRRDRHGVLAEPRCRPCCGRSQRHRLRALSAPAGSRQIRPGNPRKPVGVGAAVPLARPKPRQSGRSHMPVSLRGHRPQTGTADVHPAMEQNAWARGLFHSRR